MRDQLLNLMAARKGHYRLESGHHGDLWLELDPLYVRPCRLRPFTTELARRLAVHHVEAVCGPLLGGAFLAQLISLKLDVEFYFAEQFARPSADGLFPIGYRIPEALRRSIRGKRVAVVDDVINAGSAVSGAFADVRACGAEPVALGALLVLGSPATEFAESANVALESLESLPNTLWEPSRCPLCVRGVTLEGVARPS
jgi:orotate phosphoribosyltransferase